MSITKSVGTGFIVAALATLGACAGNPTLTEQNFGDSVRQMVRAQTYDASTLETPSTATPESTDGQLLEGALEAYRSVVAEPQQVGNDIVISVGGQR